MAMETVIHAYKVRRGESVTLSFRAYDDAGADVNMGSGYSFKFSIGPHKDAADADRFLAINSTDNPGQFSLTNAGSGTNNVLNVALTSANTQISVGSQWWDVRFTAGSVVKNPAAGPFVVEGNLVD